jgi:hypothetical protein
MRNIDYSNTIIYKICAKDKNICDMYIGHTTNFESRKLAHHISSNNKKNNLRLYKFIRENGGWENWEMTQIASYKCNNLLEARMKEQIHYEEYKPTLNCNPPYVDKKKYTCEPCNVKFDNQTQYGQHLSSNKHNIKVDSNQEQYNDKNEYKFVCEKCCIKTNNKKDYNNHLATKRHNAQVESTVSIYLCKTCKNEYTTRAGLWKHTKNCVTPIEEPKNEMTDKEMISHLLKENSRLLEIISTLLAEKKN